MSGGCGDGGDGPVVVFAGGGTGGHLYPALSIAESLRTLLPGVRIVFFSTTRRIDRHILDQAACDVVCQSLVPLSIRPWRWPAIIGGLRRASAESRRHIGTIRPMVVVGTGGLGSVPAVRQAIRAGVPTAILNPDAIPGRANRMLASRVRVVFAQFEATVEAVPRRSRVEVVGCPVRRAFRDVDRTGALSRFGLDAGRKTLLITGASQGARTINHAVTACLSFLEGRSDWQVLHLAGHADVEAVKRSYEKSRYSAHVLAYTDHMPEAIAASDLIVSRAGASTLAELTAAGKPSVLMPYPFDRARHQSANAACLADAGAAVIIDDAADTSTNARALRATLETVMSDDALRARMAACSAAMGKPDAACNVARRLVEIAREAGTLRAVETVEHS